jgi:RNA polymerase sigma-70 factor (ECF subfamily)
VRHCVLGERHAWRQLHRRYYPIVTAFLGRMGLSRGEIEDASQNVFLRVFKGLGSFRGEAELKTWIYRVCLTEASRTHRRLGVTKLLRELFARHATDAVVSPTGPLDSMLQSALERLKPAERAVFVLCEMDGLSTPEIARIVGCPEATVYRRLHYARRAFRACVEGTEAEGAS